MNSFKTELFKVSFDQNDFRKIVHIEHLKGGEVQSFFSLMLLVAHAAELQKASGQLSKKEAIKIISKASEWML